MADIKFLITVEESGAKKKIESFDKALGNLAQTTSKQATPAMGGFKGAYAKATLAITAGLAVYHAAGKAVSSLTGFMNDCIQSAIESENVENNLRLALETTGHEVEGNAVHFLAYAEQLMAVTKYTDEEVEAAQALMLQMGLQTRDVDEATRGAIGLASVFKMDLETASRLVGKAFQGNVDRLGMYIPQLKHCKTEAEKVALVHSEVAKMFDRAKGEVNTFGGSLGQLKKYYNELKENIGKAVSESKGFRDIIQATTQIMKDFIDPAARTSTTFKTFAMIIEVLADKIKSKFGPAMAWMLADMAKAKAEAHNAGITLENWTWLWEQLVRVAPRVAGALKDFSDKINDAGNKTYTAGAKIETAVTNIDRVVSRYWPKVQALTAALWRDWNINLGGMELVVKNLGETTKARTMMITRAWLDASRTAAGASTAMAKIIWQSKEDIIRFVNEILRAMLALRNIHVPSLDWKNLTARAETAMDEVSTIVADAMRNIAKSIVEAFGFADSLLYKTKAFDSKYFDDLQKAIERNYRSSMDIMREYYDRQINLANSAFDAQERRIGRQEEDEDIRFRRKYERERAAIENSSMSEKEKEKALLALEIKYEDAKLARERKREDEKLERERKHEEELAKIREEEKKAELKLEMEYQLELDRIRAEEDRKRQEHADAELRRQNSLWNKVKGIFGKAVEEMATVWLTKLIGNITGSMTTVTSSVGTAMSSVSTTISSIATAIATTITTLAAAIGTAIASIATGIATAIVTLATAIATAATILAAAIVPLAIIGAFAVALYAAFKLVGAIIDKIAGGSGGTSSITYWLKLMLEVETKILNWTIGGITVQLENYVKGPMVEKFDALKASTDLTRDQMIPRLDKIVEYTALLKRIQFGQHGLDTMVNRPTMFVAGERGAERVTITPNVNFSSTPIHVHVSLDGKQVAIATARYAPELSRDGVLKFHQRGLITAG